MKNYFKLVLSIIGCLLVGYFGTIFTTLSLYTWYANLIKPPFNPPGYLFGPVWTILYVLMGISFYLVWKKGVASKRNREAVYTFIVQLGLNALWTPVFFGFRNTFWGLIVLIILLVYIVKTILAFLKINKTAAYLLLPYLIWVCFATILNFSVWYLNM